MCRRKRQETEQQDVLDALSPYDEDITRFFERINLVTDNVADLTKKVVGSTYDYANSREFTPWWRHDSRMPDSNNIDDYMAKPYQTRDKDLDGDRLLGVPFRAPFGLFNVFGPSGGRTPFGIYSYKGPSAREYNDCVRKNGESVWDSEGYWRCLFPNSEVPERFLEYKRTQLAGQILTKEDFDEATHDYRGLDPTVMDLGPKGVFFRQFGDFLNWKNAMYENVRLQREATRTKMRELKAKNDSTRQVVSSSVQSEMNSDYDTKEVVLRETRTEVFDDGTSVTKNITKSKPFGAGDWITVDEDVQNGDAKSGWFWNSK